MYNSCQKVLSPTILVDGERHCWLSLLLLLALTTSMICCRVIPNVRMSGSDSFMTGLQKNFRLCVFKCCYYYSSFIIHEVKPVLSIVVIQQAFQRPFLCLCRCYYYFHFQYKTYFVARSRTADVSKAFSRKDHSRYLRAAALAWQLRHCGI